MINVELKRVGFLRAMSADTVEGPLTQGVKRVSLQVLRVTVEAIQCRKSGQELQASVTFKRFLFI